MKKYLAVILSVLFVLSFAASAFAIHAEIPSETQAVVAAGNIQIKLSGEIRTRGWYFNDLGSATLLDFDNETETTIAKLPTNKDYVFDKSGGVITLDSTTNTHSSAYYDERIRLALDATVAPGVMGRVMLENGAQGFLGEASASDVYKWGGPSSPDMMPGTTFINEAWILYSGSGLFGFTSGVKVGHMPLALGEKLFFDHTKYGDDAIVFFMNPIKPLEMALLTIKFVEQSSPEIGNTADIDGYVGLATYKLDDKNTVGANFTYLNQSIARFKLQDLSLHANGNVAGLGYKAEGDIQFGSTGEGVDKADFKGYGAMVGLSYNLNPATLRASAALGSGQKSTDSDVKGFVTFLSSGLGLTPNASADQHYTLVYEYNVSTAAGDTGTGISNTTYFNLGADFAATKDLTASLDGYILRATRTDSGVSKNVGWEVDGKVVYALAKNLNYQVDAGYFKAGHFYDDSYGIDSKGVTVLRHMLTLSF